MKDVRLTKASGTWNLSKTNGLFDWVEDGAQAAQHATIRMHFTKKTTTTPGHYTLNDTFPHKTDLGMDLYGIILDHSKSDSEKEFEIKRIWLATPGIKSVLNFQMEQTGSTISITGLGVTDWGEIDMSQTFEVL